jgi:hypothetical protein
MKVEKNQHKTLKDHRPLKQKGKNMEFKGKWLDYVPLKLFVKRSNMLSWIFL